MRILFKYASRSRPLLFKRGVDSIINNLSGANEVCFLVTIDDDDVTMSSDYVLSCFPEGFRERVIVDVGKSTSKIHAINRGVELVEAPWEAIVVMSDDMVFTKHGFDCIISEKCGADTFLHLRDVYHNENLCTLSIMGRDYYDRFGYIYHPKYVSEWCDNEATEVAKKLKRWVYVQETVYKHLHPAWGTAKTDPLYRKSSAAGRNDSRTYNERAAKNFPDYQ